MSNSTHRPPDTTPPISLPSSHSHVSERIDLLEAQLADATDRRQTVDMMNSLADALREQEPARAIEMGQRARALAGHTYQRGLAESYLQLGQAHVRLANYAEALALLLEALSRCTKIGYSHGRALALNAIGLVFLYLGEYSDALERFLGALEEIRDADDRAAEAMVLNNIGYLYLLLDEYAKARRYLLDCIDAATAAGATAFMADAFDNMCTIHLQLGDYEQATTYGLRSVALWQSVGHARGESEALVTVGEVYRTEEEYGLALQHYQRALDRAARVGLRHQEMAARIKIGEVHADGEQPAEALSHLQHALNMAETLEASREQATCHRVLAGVYKQIGDFKRALSYFEQFHSLERSIFNETMEKRRKLLEILHQVETAQREIEIYQLRNVALQEEIEQREKMHRALTERTAELARANDQLEAEIAERRRAEERLRELATTDALTNVFNRRHLFVLAEQAFKQAKRYDHTVAVLMIDVDNFKRINDRYGHAVGDQVLQLLAASLRKFVRAADILGRYGGEEFVIVMPEMRMEAAAEIAERLRRFVDTGTVETAHGPVETTISIGVAVLDHDRDTTIDQLFDRADRGLYAAKQAGRNRIMQR